MKKTTEKTLSKQECILYFLQQSNVTSDNNGTEKAIRNIKVNQKISAQFKSLQSANVSTVIRYIIDNSIKNGNNVLYALNKITTFGTE
ncbi:MAG: transposase [Ferruginibacter sp.]|nr:transposase [Ferruginibacter sp.]